MLNQLPESLSAFTSGDHAPTAADALHGAVIPNSESFLGLVLNTDQIPAEGSIDLDTTTEPPTLRILNVGAKALWGEAGGTVFVSRPGADKSYFSVSGDYQGPGSELTIR